MFERIMNIVNRKESKKEKIRKELVDLESILKGLQGNIELPYEGLERSSGDTAGNTVIASLNDNIAKKKAELKELMKS